MHDNETLVELSAVEGEFCGPCRSFEGVSKEIGINSTVDLWTANDVLRLTFLPFHHAGLFSPLCSSPTSHHPSMLVESCTASRTSWLNVSLVFVRPGSAAYFTPPWLTNKTGSSIRIELTVTSSEANSGWLNTCNRGRLSLHAEHHICTVSSTKGFYLSSDATLAGYIQRLQDVHRHSGPICWIVCDISLGHLRESQLPTYNVSLLD